MYSYKNGFGTYCIRACSLKLAALLFGWRQTLTSDITVSVVKYSIDLKISVVTP